MQRQLITKQAHSQIEWLYFFFDQQSGCIYVYLPQNFTISATKPSKNNVVAA